MAGIANNLRKSPFSCGIIIQIAKFLGMRDQTTPRWLGCVECNRNKDYVLKAVYLSACFT